MNEPLKIVPARPDAEIADELRKDVLAALATVANIVERAKQQGFIIQFAIGPGPLGPIAVTQLQVLKQF